MIDYHIGEDAEMSAAVSAGRQMLPRIPLLFFLGGTAEVLVNLRNTLPRVEIGPGAGLVIYGVLSPVTQIVIAHAVRPGWKRGPQGDPAAALLGALGADGRDVDGAMCHRSVSSVPGKAKPRELPVGWDAPFDDGVEQLYAVVFAVGALKTMPDAGSIRAHVVFERGRLGVPGGPDGPVVVAHLGYLVQPPFALVHLAMIGRVIVGHAYQPPIGVIAPPMERTSEHQGVAIVVAADLHPLVPARVQENVQPLVAAVAHQDDFLFAHAGHHEIAWIRHLALVTYEEPGPGKDLFQFLMIDILVDIDFPAHEATVKINKGAEGTIPV